MTNLTDAESLQAAVAVVTRLVERAENSTARFPCETIGKTERQSLRTVLDALKEARDIPPAVKIALKVLMNHVEPGWDNCKTVIQIWLDEEAARA